MNLKKPATSSVVIWALVALMLVLIIFSIFVRREDPVAITPEERAYPVEVMTLIPQCIADTLTLPGRIEPALRARLPADKPGRITEILVDRGDTVKKDQLLLRLDNRLWAAMLEATELELREAQKEFDRWTEVEATGAISTSDMDQIRTRLDRARIQITEAATHVAQCEVRSPVDGVINERFAETGEYATEGMPVFELVVTDPVKIRLDVPERDAGPLEAAGTAAFTVTVLPDLVFTGRITFAAPAAQPANNAFRMDLETPNADGLFRPGMIAEVQIVRGQLDDALAVPLDAIIPRRGEHFVFTEADGRAVRKLVRIDRITGNTALLSDGLEPGETVIVRGQRSLQDGALLAIQTAEPAKESAPGTAP